MGRTDRRSTSFSGPVLRGELELVTSQETSTGDAIAVAGFLTPTNLDSLDVFDLVGGAMVVPLGIGTGDGLYMLSRLYPMFDEDPPDPANLDAQADVYLEVPCVYAEVTYADGADIEVGATAAALRTGLDAVDQFGSNFDSATVDLFLGADVIEVSFGASGYVGGWYVPAKSAAKLLVRHQPKVTAGATSTLALVAGWQGDAQR